MENNTNGMKIIGLNYRNFLHVGHHDVGFFLEINAAMFSLQISFDQNFPLGMPVPRVGEVSGELGFAGGPFLRNFADFFISLQVGMTTIY